MIRVERVSETSVMVYFGDAIDVTLTPVIAEFTNEVKNHWGEIIELTPSYTCVLVEVSASLLDFDLFESQLNELAHFVIKKMERRRGVEQRKLITLPVCYDHSVAPDLKALAMSNGLTEDQVIEIHSGKEYTVCAIGFAPGFAFLAEVDERVAHVRHAEPRQNVIAGSVGIADSQTAVYPQDSPGGWRIIGNCPVSLFDLKNDPVTPFEVGDRVKFKPITLEEHLEKGGKLWDEK